MVYLIPFFLIIILSFIYEFLSKNERISSVLFKVILGYFTFLMAFRYRVGGDTLRYMESYKYIPDLIDINITDVFSYYYTDPLFTLLCSFSKLFGEDFIYFQIWHTILLNILIYIFIYRNTEKRLFALWLYILTCFFYFNTEVLRESLSVAFFVNSISFIKNRQWFKYYIVILVAIGFHFSSVFALFIPFFFQKRISFKFYVFSIILLGVIFVFMGSILEFMQYKIGFTFLMNKGFYNEGEDFNINWYIFNLSKHVFLPFSLYLLVKEEKNSNEFFLFSYTLLGLCSIVSPILFTRFTNYFILFFIVVFSDKFRFSISKIGYTILLLAVCFIYTFDSMRIIFSDFRYYERFYPYSSVFNKHIYNERENYIFDVDLR